MDSRLLGIVDRRKSGVMDSRAIRNLDRKGTGILDRRLRGMLDCRFLLILDKRGPGILDKRLLCTKDRILSPMIKQLT